MKTTIFLRLKRGIITIDNCPDDTEVFVNDYDIVVIGDDTKKDKDGKPFNFYELEYST